MSSKRYTQDQILKVLKEIDDGATIAAVGRAHGVGVQTIYEWRRQYAGMGKSNWPNSRLSKRRTGGSSGLSPTRRWTSTPTRSSRRENGEPCLPAPRGEPSACGRLHSCVLLPGGRAVQKLVEETAERAQPRAAREGAGAGGGESALRFPSDSRAA